QLNIEVELRINHRKILAGLAMACGGADRLISITTAIDKLDKIGVDKVKMELAEKDLGENEISIVQEYLGIQGTNEEKLERLSRLLKEETANHGVQDIRYVLNFFPGAEHIVVDLSLARGLNYYTGIIFEVRAKNISMGSIGGGGRYDNLTGLFGVPDIPGVGISFGVDRIYDVMEELKLFPAAVQHSTTFLFFNLGPEAVSKCFSLAEQLRNAGIRCELYPEQTKFDKQFRYAEKKHIPFVIIIGTEELSSQTAKIKNLATGVQEECGFG